MRHLTVRPLFVLGLPFAVLLLIPLWAGFGAFGGVVGGDGEGGEQEGGHSMGGMNMDGEDMGDPRGMFAQKVKAFIKENKGEDGCVRPTVGMSMGTEMKGGVEKEAGQEPVVYLQALQWAYRPSKVCLEAGRTYEFRMMATDVIHGASMQLGNGSRMTRLPPGVEVTQEITFDEPGEYLLYCSYYCGVGHQSMKGQIIIEPGKDGRGDRAEAGGQ